MKMKKFLILILCFFLALVVSACEDENKVIVEPEEIEEIEEVEEIEEDETIFEPEEIHFSQEDFILKIDTLPYRGAVLFIDYLGDIDISDYELWVEIIYNEKITQRDMVTEVNDNFISTIVDLMYLPGDELEFVLIVKDESQEQEWKHSYFQTLERHPFKDWMLAKGEWFYLGDNSDNFVYGKPSWGGVGAHASWDIWTQRNAPVYSGTIGVVVLEKYDSDSVEIFNPYVGVIIQYGHINPAEDIHEGKVVTPGQHIGNVCPIVKHIHYSTIRPYKIGWDRTRDSYWFTFDIFQEGNLYDLKYYKDPFYFHEPTTLGYWHEETLPKGVKEEMLKKFKKHNDIVLPARKPLHD